MRRQRLHWSVLRCAFMPALLLAALLSSPPTTALARAGGCPLSLIDGTHLRIDVLEDRVEVLQVLHVHNSSLETHHPGEGLLLGLPEGARGVRSDQEVRVDEGAELMSVKGPFPPGISLVRLAYSLPVEKGGLRFRQALLTESSTVHLLLPKMPGLDVAGDSVRSVAAQESNGLRVLLVDLDTKDGRLSFDLTGLPSRPAQGRWIALFIAAAMVLLGVVLAGPRASDRAESIALAGMEEEKERILEELFQLALDEEEGLIEKSDHDSDREELLSRLAVLLRSSEQAAQGEA